MTKALDDQNEDRGLARMFRNHQRRQAAIDVVKFWLPLPVIIWGVWLICDISWQVGLGVSLIMWGNDLLVRQREDEKSKAISTKSRRRPNV